MIAERVKLVVEKLKILSSVDEFLLVALLLLEEIRRSLWYISHRFNKLLRIYWNPKQAVLNGCLVKHLYIFHVMILGAKCWFQGLYLPI